LKKAQFTDTKTISILKKSDTAMSAFMRSVFDHAVSGLPAVGENDGKD